MFNPHDFENINSNEPDAIPDGIVDASDYHKLLEQVTSYLQETDYDDSTSRMVCMMNVINLFHESEDAIDENKVYGVTIGLMYHIQTVFSGMLQEDRDEYFQHIRNEILPIFESESTTLPYFESDFGGSTDE